MILLSVLLTEGALEEVDWLRNKLEVLEKALRESIVNTGTTSRAPQLDPDTLIVSCGPPDEEPPSLEADDSPGLPSLEK